MKILAIGDFHAKFPDKIRELIKREKPNLILSDGDYAGIDELRPAFKKMFKENDKGNSILLVDIIGEEKYTKLMKKDYSAGKMPLRELNKFGIPVFSVFGNGDWYKWEFENSNRDYAKLVKNLKFLKNIHRSSAKIRGVKITGFGGYIDNDVYLNKDYVKRQGDSAQSVRKRKQRRDKERKIFLRLAGEGPDILLLHYTPYKCLDVMKEKGYYLSGKHMGVSFFNEGIKKYKPALVICGHMHENQGQCKIGSTLVVNPGAAHDGRAAIIDFDEKEKKVVRVKFI